MIGFLVSSPTLIWSSDTTDLEVIEVSLVSLEEVSSEPVKPKTESMQTKPPITNKKTEKQSQEIKKATTVVSEFNPSNIPSKRNDNMPETMISPPKKLDPTTLAIKPKKQNKVSLPKKSSPLKRPSSDDSVSLKQQPEASPPPKSTKKALSLEAVLKSIKQRNNERVSGKKNQKSSAPQKKSSENENKEKSSQISSA